MTATVGLTDALWYCAVALLVSRPLFLQKLQRNSRLIDRLFGLLLIALALSVLVNALIAQ